ncbi:hypothetical protein D9756_007756 [Leucocoprinus leucothites]|uniref:Uncharacterized protein n=1 Tax=Leucocoprinus leucothites TaxID=201217 RepID=A0A8H5FWY5_9AGAR|nr:hypothetical protein D9756_007756 [Leucoagaricus leucothites]
MPRAPVFPSADVGGNDSGPHFRSVSSPERSRSTRLPGMSVLASVKLPYLRRPGPEEAPSTTHKTPLLTLKLSSHSFLDCTLKDDVSTSPLYTIRTVGMTTTIMRADPWQESIRTADIKWPKIIPPKGKGKGTPDGVLVQLKGSRWKGGDSFLKPSTSKSGSRKFKIPYLSHSMKWQKQGTAYWCTTSPMKGPIAVFDPPVDHLPGRLTIYETLHDKYDTSPMLVHQGVSIFLLDYLLVTTILLVTDLQEWMLVQSASSSTASTTDQPPNTSLQWRKIAHGEPLFPKLPPAIAHHSTDGLNKSPATPTSQEQMAKIVHGDPLYPRIKPGSKSVFSFSSYSDEGEDNGSDSGDVRTGSPSPSAESSLDPVSNNSSAPPHTYIDPSFYLEHGVPPIPPLPSHYTGQTSLSQSSVGSRSARVQELPVSLNVSRPWLDATSPPLIEPNTRAEMSSSTSSVGPADASLWKRRPSEPVITRARSVSRPLPRTPNTPSADVHSPVIRRVQSHNRINEVDIQKPWLQTSPPPLPPAPFTSTAPRTPRTGRSLPPTPFDLAMGRPTGGFNAPVASGLQIPRKSLDNNEATSEWDGLLGCEEGASHSSLARPSFDQPPPAYSSIDFSTTHPQPWTTGT